LGFFKFILLLQ